MSNNAENQYLVTPDNGVIPKCILNNVRIEATRVVPTLESGRAYLAEDICAAIWDRLSKYEHTIAGRALKYLANSGMVQVRYAGRDGKNHSLYVRTD